MARWDDEHQLVDESTGEASLPWPQLVATDDAKIYLAGADALFDQARISDLQTQLDAGVTSAKQADHGWHEIDAGGRAGADDEGATLEAVDLLDGPSAVGNRRDDSRGVGFEHPPGLGRRSPASAATSEQPRTQFPLEFGNVLGQRWLRQINATGRGHPSPDPLPPVGARRVPARPARGRR